MLLGRSSRLLSSSFFRIPFSHQFRSCSVIINRLEKWKHLEKKRSLEFGDQCITIRLPDNTEEHGTAHKTTLLDILKKKLSDDELKLIVAANIQGEIVELMKPLTKDTIVSGLVSFHSPAGRNIFWHSSAHLLGYSLEQLHALDYTPENWKDSKIPSRISSKRVLLDDGPSLESGGFFYDCSILSQDNEHSAIKKPDIKRLLKWMKFLKDKEESFERMELSKEEAMDLFDYNPFKLSIIEKLPSNAVISCYRVGEFIDLCKGPHIPNTSYLKWFDITGTSSVESSSGKEEMQRITGISFPEEDMKEKWENQLKEAKKNDHRTIGKIQQLFMTHPYSAGSPFFLPHGVIIYHRLQQYLVEEYKKRGYQQVMTPNIFVKELWETSGHWDNYKENMFTVVSNHGINDESCDKHSKEHFCMKPMNCPAHCLIFEHQTRSYRDLPIRLAEFGVLHRDELAGTLTGLTRVRRFVQDDAHIFCMEEQIGSEVTECLKFVQSVYSMFNFSFSLSLSTRPEKAIGSMEQWNRAEDVLKKELERSGLTWELNEGDGAFYGPKIDVTITDIHQRQHQCATIQLDFQLPERFKLEYVGSDGQKHRPIMIHRAILGSFERFIAILSEHTHGRWPLWLSPRQCIVCSVNDSTVDYANEIVKELQNNDILAEVNFTDGSISKKIRDATELKFNYIILVGEKEKESKTISFRERGSFQNNSSDMKDFLDKLKQQIKDFN